MSVFADSSALVKRYAKEEGQNLVRQIPVLVISHLARVEVPSAFWRKQRMGQLSNRQAAVLVSLFENDYYDTEDKAPFLSLIHIRDRACFGQACGRGGSRDH